MDTILQDLSPSTIPLAYDTNLFAYYTLYSGLPGAELHDDGDLRWFETGVPEHTFNGVFQARTELAALPQAIARVLAHFRQRSLPFHWHLGPSSQPGGFGHLLEAQGIEHVEDEPVMAVDLLAINEDLQVASNLAIHPVTNSELVHQWTQAWGCGAPEEVVKHWFTIYSGLPIGPPQALRLYLGTVDDQPVATVALLLAAGVASINWVVTIPEYRHRGIGAAMTLLAAREARSAGYRIAVLTASPMGINIYRRLGFKEYCQVGTYEWTPVASR
jgi:GNAT superfamily N-acetyltransferase